MTDNLVAIQDFKHRKAAEQLSLELSHLQKYYRNLDFHGLIQETHGLIEELDRAQLTIELLDRSTSLLKEYEFRCQSKSPQMLETLTQMRERIEIRVKSLSI
jgi:hypothetical protein